MQDRIEGLDFARALALFGMFIVNFTALTAANGKGSAGLIAFMDLFEGRASALFVLLAGIGTTLMTKKALESNDQSLLKAKQKTIQKRALFLFITGLILYTIGWTGDILHYYAIYMLLAAMLLKYSYKIIIVIITLVLIVTEYIQLNFDYLKGWNSQALFIEYEDFWSISGFFRHLFYNGYHPIFPWVCFFLIGLLIGRLHLRKNSHRMALLVGSVLLLLSTELASKWLIKIAQTVIDYESAEFIFQTGPVPPNVFYILSNAASAILIIVLAIYLCEKCAQSKLKDVLVTTGQMSFTHYVSHIFIGIILLVALNKIENGTLLFTLIFSISFFIASMIFSSAWHKKFSRGPVEMLMRRLTS